MTSSPPIDNFLSPSVGSMGPTPESTTSGASGSDLASHDLDKEEGNPWR